MEQTESTIEWVKKAYKKLKGSLYFDKTQLPQLHQTVLFEDDKVGKYRRVTRHPRQ